MLSIVNFRFVLKYLTYVQGMAHLKQGSHIPFMSKSTNLLPEVLHLLSTTTWINNHGSTKPSLHNYTCWLLWRKHICKLKAKRVLNWDKWIKH